MPRRSSTPLCPSLCCLLVGVGLLFTLPLPAQEQLEIERVLREREERLAAEAAEGLPAEAAEGLPAVQPEDVIFPEEPMTPREELFLAIELKDLAAAREALKRGADSEISSGDPSPIATAALHNDLRMVALLLDAGGDPNAAQDSPLEEAVRNESALMVELLMRSGARVPADAEGQELFRLAQRGGAAKKLTRILLDYDADADQCLAAATVQARIELMEYCLSRGADAGNLPAEMNVLGVALTGGDNEIIDRILAGETADRMLITAFTEAVAAGRMDLVQQALAAGALPAFEQVEAAIENGQPDICLALLDHSAVDDPAVLRGGDVEALIQRAADLGYADVAGALRSKSGLSFWGAKSWLPLALGALLVVGLTGLLLSSLMGRRKPSPAGTRGIEPPARSGTGPMLSGGPRPAPAGDVRPVPASVPAAAPVAGPPVPEPRVAAPGGIETSPAATLPIGAIPMMPSAAQAPAPVAPAPVAPAPVAPAPVAQAPASNVWQLAPEPVVEARATSPDRVTGAAEPRAQPAVEIRMPDVDLSRDSESVFEAARKASSGETVRPDAPDRRQVVLVTPSRVTMLRSCAAPGSLAPEQLATAERLAGTSPNRNVAAIAYTDLDAIGDEITRAIPFFDLLRKLGYLGHAVWIFEGHVSAMAAGCRDADVLIIDDGMSPYLPGNWRSVATRVMRGSDIHVFERKTGSLRRL